MLTGEIISKIEELILEACPDAFVVDIALHRSSRSQLVILVDTDDGIKLDECRSISRKVGHYLEENDIFPFAYTLESSSPGLGNPLKLHRQYVKNIGRVLKVVLLDGTIHKGILAEVTEGTFCLGPEDKKGVKKKKNVPKTKEEVKTIEIAFDQIKQATVQISFN